jgi:hypothetical protein
MRQFEYCFYCNLMLETRYFDRTTSSQSHYYFVLTNCSTSSLRLGLALRSKPGAAAPRLPHFDKLGSTNSQQHFTFQLSTFQLSTFQLSNFPTFHFPTFQLSNFPLANLKILIHNALIKPETIFEISSACLKGKSKSLSFIFPSSLASISIDRTSPQDPFAI